MTTLESPEMLDPRPVGGGWTILPAALPVPGLGVLSVNSFLLKGREPILVDTGLAALAEPYLATLAGEIDLADLRWIWLSHMDADHIGNLAAVLRRAPNARVVTNMLGMGKMDLAGLDTSRVQMIAPGGALTAGDRRLLPVRPPYYDAPETMGFFDPEGRALFVGDAFGALLPEPAEETAAVEETALAEGMVAWSALDAPWLAATDRKSLARTLKTLQELGADHALSAHLPPASAGLGQLTAIISEAWAGDGPVQCDSLAVEALAATLGQPSDSRSEASGSAAAA